MAISVNEFRDLARARLPRFLFEYIDGGAYGETTLRRNCSDLERLQLRQRVLRANPAPALQTTLFGRRWTAPIALAPVGLAGMYARRGEVQALAAAEAAGVPFTLSTLSICSLAETCGDGRQPPWFQLYVIRDRPFMRDLLAQAAATRCGTLVFTVDMPVPGTRYRDYRSGLAGAPGWRGWALRAAQAARKPRWAWSVGLRGRPHVLGNIAPVLRGRSGLEDFFAWMGANFDPSVDWDTLGWIRSEWRGPIVIKGILDPEDARHAAEQGVDGIVVSNHGGRQLDGAPSTARALPGVADAVGDRLTVLADGGVRSGIDVLRMLALGARGVMIGRPWAWALAADGERGVRQLLDNLMAELRVAMTLTGCRNLGEIDRRIFCDL